MLPGTEAAMLPQPSKCDCSCNDTQVQQVCPTTLPKLFVHEQEEVEYSNTLGSMAASFPPGGGWGGGHPKTGLARAMSEIGFGCSIDAATFRGMIQQVDEPLDDGVVAEVLSIMARSTPGNLSPDQQVAVSNGGIPPTGTLHGDSNSGVVGWAWRVVLDAVKACALGLNWAKIAEKLDNPVFLINSVEGFLMLVHAYRYGAGEQLPVKAMAGRTWNNQIGQLTFLQHAVVAPPEVFSFAAAEHKLAPVEGLQGGKSPVGTPNQAWLSIDLAKIMCRACMFPLAEPNQQADMTLRHAATQILDMAFIKCPEVLLLSIASVPDDEAQMQLVHREWYSNKMAQFICMPNPNTPLVLRRLWSIKPNVVKEVLLEHFVQDPLQNMARVHELCQELQVLPVVVAEAPSSMFAVILAVYAVQAKSTNAASLGQLLGTRLNRDPTMTIHEVIRVLYSHAAGLQPDLALGRPTSTEVMTVMKLLGRLSEDVVLCLMQLLMPLRTQLAWDFLEAFHFVADQLARAYPAVKQMMQAPMFSTQADSEAKSTLQRLHSRSKSWEEILTQVQRLKSGSARDQELATAIMWCSLNEISAYAYEHFASDKDMQAAAMLIGNLISQNLFASVALGQALRLVLFALRAHPNMRMVNFGVTVLRQIVRVVGQFFAFCEGVQSTPVQTDPQVFNQVSAAYERVVQSGQAPPVQYGMPPPLALPGMPPPGAPTVASASPTRAAQNPIGGQRPAANNAAAPGHPAQHWPSPAAQTVAPGPALPWAHRDVAAPNPAPSPAAAVPGHAGGMAANNDRGRQSVEGNDIEGELETTLLAPAPQPTPSSRPTLGASAVSLENASEKHLAPPEAIHDRVHFLVNNLSEDSLEGRAVEIKNKVFPEYLGWFCEYMAKRAAQEPNYQPLYLRMLDKIGDRALFKQLIHSTYFYVRLLLTGDRAVNNSNDRALLKNLGHWLGALTFKRDKPVLSKELDLKQMVIEAYQRGRLVSVLPFLSNLLSCCERSRVFTATNPMISALLSVLAELHKLPHLKFNAQYCIEMIFKTFANPTVESTNILVTLSRDNIHNQDFTTAIDDGLDKGIMSPETSSNMAAMMNPAALKLFNQQVMGGSRTPVKAPPHGLPAQGTPPPPAMGTPTAMSMVGGMQGAASPSPATPGMAAAMEVNKQESFQMTRQAVAAQVAGAAGGAAAPAAPPGMPTPQTPPVPQPTGLCTDHNAMIQFLSQNAMINPSLGAIAERLMLKRHVPTAIERAIWEILNPVVERSVTIACYTTYELLSKDFALDGDETRMRKAAHLMVSSLAGSLSLVTCKDPLRIALSNHLTQLLSTHPQAVDKATLDQVVTVVVQDNLESCCTVFERAATDKAVRDVDKQLADKYEDRVQARNKGRVYQDTSAFHGRFPAQLPESLRPRPGLIGAMQLRVYEDFARIPRSPPPAAPAAPMAPAAPGARFYGMPGEEGMAAREGMPVQAGGPVPATAVNMALVETQYLSWQGMVDAAATKAEAAGEQGSQDLSNLMQELVDYNANQAPEEALRFFIQRMFSHMFEVAAAPGMKLAVTFYIQALQNTCNQLASKAGTGPPNLAGAWNMMVEDERRYSKEVVEQLLRLGLMGPPAELDPHLARAISVMKSLAAQELVAHLARVLVLRDHVLSFTDLALSLEALGKAAQQARAGSHVPSAMMADQHLQVVEQVRRAAAGALLPNRPPNELPGLVREKPEPGAEKQVQDMLEQWLRLCSAQPGVLALASNPNLPNVADNDRAALANMLNLLRSSTWFKDEAGMERWIRLSIDIVINHSYSVAEQAAQLNRVAEPYQLYLAADALWRLFTALTVHGGSVVFLRHALTVMAAVIKRDADDRAVAFNGRPHLRLFVGLMNELLPASASVEVSQDAYAIRYARMFAEALYALQPLSVPGWAFCWLTAIAHRSFMPFLLINHLPPLCGWQLYEGLLVSLLRFLEPHLKSSSELTECVRALYKGTLRLLLVLLHDFPEFLCEHHFSLCDAIPVSCVQLRNLVLSAFPRSMRLPDPFTPGLKVDLLPEIMQVPRVVPEPDRLLERHEALRASVDAYLRNRMPASLPADLARAFKQAIPTDIQKGNTSGASLTYNTSLINAVVMYVGATARPVTPGGVALADGPALDLFLRLMHELDSEGRYLVLNAVANQLRYPNSHTYAFSCLLLGLFLDVKNELVQEQITRVLLERLVVNRPHPWGLLITFIELIKNPRYTFWTHEFTRNGPDVERLFKNVAASCMAHTSPAPGAAGGAAGAERKEGEDAVRA